MPAKASEKQMARAEADPHFEWGIGFYPTKIIAPGQKRALNEAIMRARHPVVLQLLG
jgi:hypothetical protein